MARDLVRRLISILLLALVTAGGGRLPTVDALVFHEAVANPETFRSHFEASSGCHDDGCSIRSVAHESRSITGLATPELRFVAVADQTIPTAAHTPPPVLRVSSHQSRAPPISV